MQRGQALVIPISRTPSGSTDHRTRVPFPRLNARFQHGTTPSASLSNRTCKAVRSAGRRLGPIREAMPRAAALVVDASNVDHGRRPGMHRTDSPQGARPWLFSATEPRASAVAANAAHSPILGRPHNNNSVPRSLKHAPIRLEFHSYARKKRALGRHSLLDFSVVTDSM